MSDIYSGLGAHMSAAGYPIPPDNVVQKCLLSPGRFFPFGKNYYRLKMFNNSDGSQVIYYLDNSNRLEPGSYIAGRPEKPLTPEQPAAFEKALNRVINAPDSVEAKAIVKKHKKYFARFKRGDSRLVPDDFAVSLSKLPEFRQRLFYKYLQPPGPETVQETHFIVGDTVYLTLAGYISLHEHKTAVIKASNFNKEK